MSNIPALIGYRATGKTTIGRLLARNLGFECIDTDSEIERRAGCSIKEIFAQQGETAFRDLESEVVEDVTQRENVVLSFGGGAILRPKNRQKIIERCQPVVWLTASVEKIHERISHDAVSQTQRPNLTSMGGIQEIRSVLQQRLKLYAECASITVDTETQSPEEIAKSVYRLIVAAH